PATFRCEPNNDAAAAGPRASGAGPRGTAPHYADAFVNRRRSIMSRRIAVVPGDLAGREVVPEAVRVLQAAGLGYEFEEFEVGAAPVLRGEPAMSDETFAAISGADAILFGAIGDP